MFVRRVQWRTDLNTKITDHDYSIGVPKAKTQRWKTRLIVTNSMGKDVWLIVARGYLTHIV